MTVQIIDQAAKVLQGLTAQRNASTRKEAVPTLFVELCLTDP
jgi:hypothetical protein